MTKIRLISFSKPAQGEAHKQEFIFEGRVNTDGNSLIMDYFDPSIQSNTAIEFFPNKGSIENANASFLFTDYLTETEVITPYGKLAFLVEYISSKITTNSFYLKYTLYNREQIKITDILLKYSWENKE